jgi:hypothetical protein
VIPDLFLVFDVESVGLHGEGFAVGWVVVDRDGNEVGHGRESCRPELAAGSEAGLEWVRQNIPLRQMVLGVGQVRDVRDAFWAAWTGWKARGAVLAADCGWPVEARFLAACIDDDWVSREWHGPYPLHDIASVRLAAGLDPLATEPRLPSEFPVHDPLADARQSARLLIEALGR